jgi:2-polyprenyl-6-methoxyphenol hydroxylase-like FAD-dependent oxidoreductase
MLDGGTLVIYIQSGAVSVRTDVLIIGAGPAGLTLAALLAEHNVDFRILDRKSGPVDQSRAALVHVRTLELLDKLGLSNEAVARGVKTNTVEIYERGKRAASFPLAGKGAEAATPHPFALGLPQHETEQLLVRHLAARGRAVTWCATLTGLTVTPTQTTAAVRRHNGTTDTISARWVVGADGARSPVRHALGIDFSGDTYSQTGLLADVELELPTDEYLPTGTLRLNLTSGGFVGIFGLGNGRHRLFGAVPAGFTAPDHDSEISHDPYAEVASADIQQWLDDFFAVDAQIRSTSWASLFRIHSRIADHFRSGSAFLVGDAAHIHSPAGGQGMNLAIGDAFNLGWKLALVANRQAHEQLLDSYEAERYPVAKTVLRGSDRGFALETTSNPLARWIRTNVATRLIGPLTRLGAVRSAIFALFSQTWIAYPHSPAIAHEPIRRAGPHPGERAPFDQFKATHQGASIFDVCGGVRHHMLLFEGPTPNPHSRSSRRLLENLLAQYAVEITIHDVPAAEQTLHARYGARAPQVWLIRPDGHLAYSGAPEDLDRLRSYLDRIYVRQAPTSDHKDGRPERS